MIIVANNQGLAAMAPGDTGRGVWINLMLWDKTKIGTTDQVSLQLQIGNVVSSQRNTVPIANDAKTQLLVRMHQIIPTRTPRLFSGESGERKGESGEGGPAGHTRS